MRSVVSLSNCVVREYKSNIDSRERVMSIMSMNKCMREYRVLTEERVRVSGMTKRVSRVTLTEDGTDELGFSVVRDQPEEQQPVMMRISK